MDLAKLCVDSILKQDIDTSPVDEFTDTSFEIMTSTTVRAILAQSFSAATSDRLRNQSCHPHGSSSMSALLFPETPEDALAGGHVAIISPAAMTDGA